MGATGKRAETITQADAMQRLQDLVKNKLSAYDPRYSDAILKAAQFFEDEFSGAWYVSDIDVGKLSTNNADALASMNGFGRFGLDEKILNNYGVAKNKAINNVSDRWWAGKAQDLQAIFSHEMSHNLDMRFASFMADKLPDKNYNVDVKDQNTADQLSYALKKNVKIGDTVKVPMQDFNAKFINFDGEKVDYSFFGHFDISNKIVDRAISNVQKNWKALGFSEEPSKYKLLGTLSGYARDSYVTGNNTNLEIFAEAMTGYIAHGKNSTPLSREIYRITKGMYNSIAAAKQGKGAEVLKRSAEWISKNK